MMCGAIGGGVLVALGAFALGACKVDYRADQAEYDRLRCEMGLSPCPDGGGATGAGAAGGMDGGADAMSMDAGGAGGMDGGGGAGGASGMDGGEPGACVLGTSKVGECVLR